MKLILERVGIDEKTTEIIWKEGKPVEALNKVCESAKVDLLILGARKNEDLYRYYIGSVARKISRKPTCSLLLITEPNKKESNLNNVVVTGVENKKTNSSIKVALSFSNQFKAKELTIVEEVKPSKVKTRINDHNSLREAYHERKELEKEENKRIQNILTPLEKNASVRISMKCVFGKEGYSIGHFAEILGANLLVMNSPDKNLGFLDRFFPHNLEYVLSDMPCDLMIVHPKEA